MKVRLSGNMIRNLSQSLIDSNKKPLSRDEVLFEIDEVNIVKSDMFGEAEHCIVFKKNDKKENHFERIFIACPSLNCFGSTEHIDFNKSLKTLEKSHVVVYCHLNDIRRVNKERYNIMAIINSDKVCFWWKAKNLDCAFFLGMTIALKKRFTILNVSAFKDFRDSYSRLCSELFIEQVSGASK